MKLGFDQNCLLKSTTVAVILMLHPVVAGALTIQNIAPVSSLITRIDKAFSDNLQPTFLAEGKVDGLNQNTKVLVNDEDPPRPPQEGGST